MALIGALGKRAAFVGFCLLTLLFTACTQLDPAPPVTQIAASPTRPAPSQPTVTAAASLTTTPSATPTTAVSPTPTATAVSARLSGDPRTIRLTTEPEPKSGAPCGLVDLFDFPIAPPDAVGVSRGGGDFGTFRDRYNKYHAGEDWGGTGPGSNFGKPVFSIGHGRVMYAQPEGWNRDKGVVIVEHVVQTPAGREIIYSFYGHLDPPSVILEPGTCVRRGEQIGNIGKPRTPPHLHFEIRTHMPYAPGPGYWEEDPTLAGWLPPSQTIWNQRMATSPGVAWLRPFSPLYSRPLGLWRENAFLTLENGRLTQINPENGSAQPSPLVGKDIANGLIHEQTNTLFLVTAEDELLAFGDELLWETELTGNGRSDLLPLPDGEVMVVQGNRAVSYGVDGSVLWQAEMGKRPFAWTLSDDSLIYTISGEQSSIWAVNGSQPPVQLADKTGIPLAVGQTVWLYAPNGLYQLAAESAERRFALPSAVFAFSDIAPLPDGGVLVMHTDAADQRLIAFNADGMVRWDESVAALDTGTPQLVVTGEQVLLFSENNVGGNLETAVYAINLTNGDLTHVFSGGSRPYSFGDTWIMPASPSQLLLNSAGGAILALNTQQALATFNASAPPN